VDGTYGTHGTYEACDLNCKLLTANRELPTLEVREHCEWEVLQGLERDAILAFGQLAATEQVSHVGERFIDKKLRISPIEGAVAASQSSGKTRNDHENILIFASPMEGDTTIAFSAAGIQ